MNETSSRSHAVFTLILTQKRHDPQTNMTGEKVSKISLVDLAGSERQASTGATGTRLREGANINKSLTTLGIVIAALAQASAETKGRKKKDDFVPYRDSVLTWLLKESLGGNSKTAMIAAISPADYEETLSTLRYADAAKKIKTHAVVNEDPNAKLIRELKEELEILRSRVASSGGIDEADFDPSIPPETQIVTYKTKDGEIRKVTKLELQDQLEASEKLMEGLNLTWEQKMAKTQAIHVEREKALEELGISVDKGIVGVHAPQKHPSLVNLNEDPLMSECLVYQLKPGATIAGSPDGDTAHIRLSGSHILPEHCIFTNEDGVVSVEAMPDARTFVNGKRVPPKMPVKLLNGFRVILGDFHVFRYNDPAAVRAERQKMRESKSMDNFPSLEITGSRPDSPARVGDGDLMDWSAARREVADIEKLGDQDLDRLFDDIIKVRTQRKRPESRPDLAAELESRFITTSQTEDSLDTYANPWAPAQGTTMTSISINTPVLLESDRLEPVIASERTVPEPDLEVTYDPKAEDAALEQQHMTKQLKTLAQEVKRMRSQAAAAKALEDVTFEPAAWTARELRLVRHAVDKWRNLRSYKIAEEILTLAVSVREANVNAREMKKPVSYNLLVVNGEAASSTSALDNLTGIVEFENVSSPAGLTGGPCTLIKVIDYPAKAVYCWDLPRFQQQLSKMRHVRTLASKPAYSQHFRVDATFSDDPPPSLSFVGSARAPLRLLANQLSYTVTVPIMCSYTMEAIGSCRVDFKCSVPSSSGVATPESGGYPLLSPITPGSRLAFSLSVDAVKGLSSVDFAAVHAQTRLSSLVGPDIASEDTFTSALIDLTKSSVAHLSLKRSVTVNVTPEIISHLRDSYVSIDLFARVRPEYLERLERFDRSRETSPSSARPSTPPRPAEDKPGMRRCETEFVGTEYHDILASIQILELSSNGDYLPAEVLDEKFQLHQGVQRRLDITLTHSSGKSLPWLKLDHVSTSGLRAVGKAGDVTSVSKTAVELRLTTQDVEYRADGTSTLSGSGFWDTAAHHSSHLDKRTPSDQKVLVQLTWLVEVDILDEPAVFHLDIPLRILGRDAKRSSIRSFFSSEKVYSSVTSIYSLDLAPPLARSASDLWRLDTAKKHVQGEENLEGWRPRSLSLLEDFARLKRTERGLADVQATKAVLDMLGEIEGVNVGDEERVELVRRCVKLWQQEMDHRIIIDVKKESEEEEAAARKLRKLVPELAPRLVPKVTVQPRIESIIKSGVLYLLRDSQQNLWDKLYFVLRRPYIHVHPTLSEREIQVINLTRSNVIASPDVEMLLGRRHAFTIFTPTNSYILQASSPKELSEWITVISQSRY